MFEYIFEYIPEKFKDIFLKNSSTILKIKQCPDVDCYSPKS